MIDSFGVIVMFEADDDGELARKGDFDGWPLTFIHNFAKFAQMPGRQIGAAGQEAVV